MRKIKWEQIPLFFLQLLVNMATVGVAVLLNALIDAAENSIISKDPRYLQDILMVSILYAVCMGILVYLSNRYKAYYIRKYLLQMRETLANGTLQTSIADYEKAGSASYVTAFPALSLRWGLSFTQEKRNTPLTDCSGKVTRYVPCPSPICPD